MVVVALYQIKSLEINSTPRWFMYILSSLKQRIIFNRPVLNAYEGLREEHSKFLLNSSKLIFYQIVFGNFERCTYAVQCIFFLNREISFYIVV